jgi:hypothetical protein
MGLRERLTRRLQGVLDRFSGEHSAASAQIRPDDGAPAAGAAPADGVKVTRARLRRPREDAQGS